MDDSSPGPASSDVLRVEQKGAIRHLTLHRPERRNALDPELVQALRAGVVAAGNDPDTTVVVIAGAGRSFCAGADLLHLRDMAEAGTDPDKFLRGVSECFTVIESLPKPVVAVVHGHCVAGGLELALACDVVVAERGTLIGDGHVRNGLIPAGGGSVRLPRRLPEPVARWLMLSGELVAAEELHRYGFPYQVADKADLDQVVTAILRELCAGRPAAQRAAKDLLNTLRETSPGQALERESAAFATHWATADVRGPLGEFAEGRRR